MCLRRRGSGAVTQSASSIESADLKDIPVRIVHRVSQNAVCDEIFFAASVSGVRIYVKTATLTARISIGHFWISKTVHHYWNIERAKSKSDLISARKLTALLPTDELFRKYVQDLEERLLTRNCRRVGSRWAGPRLTGRMVR